MISVKRRPAPSADELRQLLSAHGGCVADVARALDRDWALVRRWCRRYALEPDEFRPVERGARPVIREAGA